VRESDAIVHRYVANRNKRQHISRAESRMFTLVHAHVDKLGSPPHSIHRCFNHSFRRGYKSYDGTVVIGIDMRVEHTC
jgi:hypothetical protein